MTCNGFGTVSRPPNIAGDVPWHVEDKLYTCPICSGRGYIVFPDDRGAKSSALIWDNPKKEKTQ
jgi:hypothetical protein